MIKFDNTAVMNFENAMRGARNPLNSWARSDSSYDENGNFVFGPNDLDLAKRLCQAGNDHRKFIRQIFISVDITAPIYWWKEYDTYKVGTVANSTSTMHKIHSKPFELSDFSTDHMTDEALEAMKLMVASLENIRRIVKFFIITKKVKQSIKSGDRYGRKCKKCIFDYTQISKTIPHAKSESKV